MSVYLVALKFKILMTETQLNRSTKIKKFEQKVQNRSVTDLYFYDKLADYLLECCHAEAKPNTLSLFSFVPLLVLSFIVTGPSTISFILTIVGILLHQLLDIANKKQAYRLSQFSLATYYIDHLFDAFSCTFIILLISRLLELTPSSTLTAVFFFGVLPFYTHHLVMYNDEYLTFSCISPTTQGLVIVKLFFLVASFSPNLFQSDVGGGIFLYQIFIGLAVAWLIIFIVIDLKTIIQGKRVTDIKSGIQEELPLKNLFVIFMLGYVVLEITSIEPELLEDSLYFYFTFVTITLVFSHIINNLVLAYGFNERYKQITLPFLIAMGIVILYYALCAFLLGGSEQESLSSKITMGITLFTMFALFVRESWKNILHINSIVSA